MKTVWTCAKHASAKLIVDTDANTRHWTVGMREPCLLGRVKRPVPGPYHYCDFRGGDQA